MQKARLWADRPAVGRSYEQIRYTITDLGTLAPTDTQPASGATSINDNDEVVGFSETPVPDPQNLCGDSLVCFAGFMAERGNIPFVKIADRVELTVEFKATPVSGASSAI